jgi:hypothetical protein
MRINIISILALTTLLLTASFAAFGEDPDYVIAGFDYSAVESMVRRKEPANIYIEKVERDVSGDRLIVSYDRLDSNKGRGVAVIDKTNITLAGLGEIAEDQVQRGPMVRQRSGYWLIGDTVRLSVMEVPQIVGSPDGEFLLLFRGAVTPASIVRSTSPTNTIAPFQTPVEAKMLFAPDQSNIIVAGGLGRGSSYVFRIVQLELPTAKVLRITDLKWADECYDMHPKEGRVLIAEERHWMPRCFEYDLLTDSRREIGLARVYMFYLKRDFAESLKLRGFVTIKRSKPFPRKKD